MLPMQGGDQQNKNTSPTKSRIPRPPWVSLNQIQHQNLSSPLVTVYISPTNPCLSCHISTLLLQARRTVADRAPMAARPRTAPASRIYVDHDPSFEWVHEEASDTLLVHLPGYKRENLKVRVDGNGMRIRGERPLDSNLWSRFQKDFNLPQNCNANGIRAKFEKETLHVNLPKLITPATDGRRAPAAEPKRGPGDHDKSQKDGKKDHSNAEAEAKGMGEGSGTGAAKAPGEEQGKARRTRATDDKRDADHDRKAGDGNKIAEPPAKQKVSGGSDGGDEFSQQETAKYDASAMAMELRQRQRSMLNVAAAVMVLVGLGVYIYYRK